MIRKFALMAALALATIVPAAASAEEAAPAITEMQKGNPDAKVTVIEYASYTCPHCANFHTNQYQSLTTDYIDTGLINFIYREVFFDRYGLWASLVARCEGSADKFFGINDLLYTGQRQWTDGAPVEIVENLRTIGKVAGLTDEQLDGCLSDADNAQALFTWFQENAERDDISGTPTFMINGQQYSNMNYADFAAVLDEKLAE